MKKIRSILIALIIMIIVPVTPVQAHSANKHYEDLEMMLFNSGNFSRTVFDEDKKVQDKILAIEYASTLCIDQMGDGNAKELKWLRDYGVRGLPKDVSEINPEKSKTKLSARNHREYTHQGWDKNYKELENGDLANWEVRKNILLASVKEAMDSKLFSKKWLFFDFGYSEKCDSFCALIYYNHILGDYMEDTSDEKGNLGKFNGTTNGEKIPFACSDSNKIDLFSELENHIAKLFKDQKDKTVYKNLIRSIQELAKKARNIADGEGKIKAEDYDEMKGYVSELMDILTGKNNKYNAIHELLMNESYFTKAFYPNGVK